ncbi:MAG: GAF domain-containing protein [Pseudomonadales bacterium]|nr:GAF domain-containing protein [Pseudomonadales bacterium]
MATLDGEEQYVIAHGEGFSKSACRQKLLEKQISCVLIHQLEEVIKIQPALLLLDSGLLSTFPENWRKKLPSGMLVGCEDHIDAEADFFCPRDFKSRPTLKNIELALIRSSELRTQARLQRDLSQASAANGQTDTQLAMLADISIALSAERNLATLLNRILSEGRKLACCDAASLYLVDKSDPDNPQMVFKLTQNASIECPFREVRFELNDSSIAGYVASHGTELHIPDSYAIDVAEPYQVNHQFDQQMGYRTGSILAIPMKNYNGEVIGVLQFINRTSEPGVKLDTPEVALQYAIPFDEAGMVLLRALASQSAIAIDNKMLIENIKKLFDGFVQASVAAIEQRDPTTSGHSFRVADLSLRLAEISPQSIVPEIRDYQFTKRDLTSLRYAALLHDFGKVGVRESVLVKPKKLTSHQFEVIRYRVRLTQEFIKRRAAEQSLNMVRNGAPEEALVSILQQAEQDSMRLSEFFARIKNANEPTILPEGYFEHLREISQFPALNSEGDFQPLISESQFLALSVERGSLTEAERLEIQSHVTHTESFLRLIPWTSDLADIPDIAAAHHEKLDGSGYPKGLGATDIPLPSKIMTICDIYDALTASDRPYKPAVPKNVAFNILESEAQRGMLDGELVRLFIDAGVDKVIEGKEYQRSTAPAGDFHHHVCDFDLMEH